MSPPPFCNVFGPLGKFKSYFSIVSPLRGQYITVNESCHFYYQWSRAGQIKTRLHILPPRLPSLTKQPCLISPPLPPRVPQNPVPLFLFIHPFPVLLFILVCLLCCDSAPIENDTAAPFPPREPVFPTSRPLPPPPSLPPFFAVFTGGPVMKGSQQTQRKPRSGPGEPRHTAHSPSSSRISHSEQSGSHGSVYVLQPYPSPLPGFLS